MKKYKHMKVIYIPERSQELMEKFLALCERENISFSGAINRLIENYIHYRQESGKELKNE